MSPYQSIVCTAAKLFPRVAIGGSVTYIHTYNHRISYRYNVRDKILAMLDLQISMQVKVPVTYTSPQFLAKILNTVNHILQNMKKNIC